MQEIGTREFKYSRRAVQRIKDESVRDDFLNSVDGIDFALDSEDLQFAVRCAEDLFTVAFALNRTITPEVAMGILVGIKLDADKEPAFKALVGRYQSGRYCDFGSPFGPGGTCEPDGGWCISRVGGGCAGGTGKPPKLVFRFPWPVLRF